MKTNDNPIIRRPCVINNPVSRVRKQFENRADWAILYPTDKRQDWHSNYSGVTRLSQTGKLYWVSIWEHQDSAGRYFIAQLKAKERPQAKPYRCRLEVNANHPDQFAGPLQLANEVVYRLALWEEARCLRIHFELKGDAK